MIADEVLPFRSMSNDRAKTRTYGISQVIPAKTKNEYNEQERLYSGLQNSLRSILEKSSLRK